MALAINAYKLGYFTSKRCVAIAYDVPESTLRMRLLGTRTHQESRSVNLKLTETEKLTHVEWILSIANRGLPVCQASIREMANLLLQKQISTNNTLMRQVGQNWVYNFIKRHDSLKSKYNRKYDYQQQNAKILRYYAIGFGLCRIKFKNIGFKQRIYIILTKLVFKWVLFRLKW
jgi:hypothetical protein